MRQSCLECVRKHIGEAEISMEEAFSGYPHHAIWAIGSFSHAASEALRAFPELAHDIREARLAFERCLVKVLTGETLTDIADELPDMEHLALIIHEMILEELIAGTNSEGVRTVRDALGLTASTREKQ